MIANKWYCIAQTGTFDSGCTINVSFDGYVIQFSASVKYGSSAINITRCELPLSANLSLRLRESNGLWSVDLLSNNDITPEIVVADSPYWVAVNSVAGAGNIILTIKDISKDFNTETGGSGGGLDENALRDFLDKYGYTRAKDFWKYETTGGGAIHTDYHIIVDGGGAFGGAELGGGGESGGGGISEFYIQLGEGGQKYKLGNSGLPNVVQIPKYPVVPTNVSEFYNDAGYIGGEQAALIFSRISEVEARVEKLEKLWWVDENGNLHTDYNIVVEKGGAFGTGASVDAGGTGGLGRVVLVNDSGDEYASDENGIVRIPDYINKIWFDAQKFATQSWVLNKGYVSESVLAPIREDITALKGDVAELKSMWTIKDGKLYTTYSIVVEGGGAFGQGASDSGEIGIGKTILITPSGLRYETNDDGYVPIPEWASQDWVNGKGFTTQTWVLSKGFLTENSADLLYAKRAELDDINETLSELVKMWRLEDGKLFTDYSIVVKGGGSFGEGSESGGGSTGGLGQITIRNQAGQEYKTDANGVVVIPTYLTSTALDGYAVASEIAKTYATIEALNTTKTNLETVTTGLADVVATVNALSKNFVNGIAKEAAKVSHALTFGSKVYDGSAAQSILASDLDAVTLSGEQVITGAKTFSSLITANSGIKIPNTASLKIGDITLIEEDGALKVLGNLVVTGGGAFGAGATTGGGGGEGFSKIIIQTEGGQSYTTNDAGVVTIPNYITSSALNGYATQSWVEGKKYLTTHQSIYSLTIKNSAGTAQITYTPNSEAASLTLTKAMVGLSNVENTTLSTWAGSSKITTLGTITSGTWNGTKIANGYLANSSMTIAGTSVSLGGSISVATLQSNLGLKALAYKDYLVASDIPDISATYVTVSTSQTISGAKTFSASIAANGGIVIPSTKSLKIGEVELTWDGKALRINKSLVVLGGGAFGEGATSGGGTSGGLGSVTIKTEGGIEYKSDSNGVVTVPNWITSASLNGYAKLTDIPTSLPASDVYAWAKKSSLALADVPDLSSKYAAVGLAGSSSYVALRNGGYIAYSGGDKWRVTNSDWTASYGILHEGNYADTTDKRYLQLRGGTISASSIEPLKLDNTVANSSCYIPFSTNGVVKAYVGWSINGYAFLQGPNNNYIAIQADGAYYNGNTLYHTGNFNPANYLPLSGGDVTGDIKTTARIKLYGTLLELDNADKTAGVFLGLGTIVGTGKRNLAIYNGTSWYDVLHENNIGSYNAGGLESEHLGNINSGTANKVFSSDFQASNRPSTENYVTGLTLANHMVGYMYQLGFSTTKGLYTRYKDSSTWQEWRELAYVDSNVASATKLQTARTIWGQSFDGTGNVSGSISYVSQIDFSNNANTGTGGLLRFFYKGSSSYTSSIYERALGQLNINDALYVNKGGNVLIGTTTDNGTKLQVNGGVTCDHITRYDSNAGYLFGSRNTALGLTDGGALVYAYGNTPISMYTNGLERMRVLGNGNVLMGTTIDSGARLHINTSVATTLQAVTTTTGLGIAQFLAPNAKTGVTGGMVLDIGVASSTYNSGNIAFRRHSNGNAANFISLGVFGNDNILNVFGSGNVAIGTTDSNPAYKLDVQGGDVRFTGNLVVYGGGAFGSDVRYKDIINYTNIDLATIADAPLFTYQWNDREDKKVYLGTSAQYWLNTAFTNAVNTDNPNFFHLDYGALGVGLAIATARKVVDHEERIATLEKENRELKKKLNKYETLWHN